MECERCSGQPVTRVATEVKDGRKRAVYLCEACADSRKASQGPSSTLERPCEMCGQVEGQIKLTRLRDGHRSIIYICEKCANRR